MSLMTLEEGQAGGGGGGEAERWFCVSTALHVNCNIMIRIVIYMH